MSNPNKPTLNNQPQKPKTKPQIKLNPIKLNQIKQFALMVIHDLKVGLKSLNKERLIVYSRLMRLDKPIGTFLLLFPTLWAVWIASNGKPNVLTVFAFSMGVFLMRSVGCVANDWFDRKIDGKVQRTQNRPATMGLVSKKEIIGLSVFLCFLALLCLIPFGLNTWLMAIPAVCLALFIYPSAKRWFPIPQLILGIAFSFGIPMAFMAVQNQIPAVGWWLFFANVFWTLAYDTIYAISDKPDDLKLRDENKENKIYTSAITFGRFDAEMAMLCYGLFDLLMMQIGLLLNGSWAYWLAFVMTIFWQWQYYLKIQKRDRETCLKVFLDNNKIGITWFVAIVIHYSYMV